MKNFIITCVSLFFFLGLTNEATAQQDALFAQYNANPFLINPAVAGSKGNHSVSLFHRWQWVRFPGAPQTFGITYQGNIKDLHGIGALFFGDVTGPSSRWGGKLSYAFHIPLAKRKMRLSIGLAARVTHNTIRTDMVELINPNDNAMIGASQGVTGADAEIGVYFYTKNLSIGFAAPNLFQTTIDFGKGSAGRTPIGQGYRHYFLTASYKFRMEKKKMSLTPSLMVKYVQGTVPQVDVGVTLGVLDEQIAFGIFYRSPVFLSFQCKFLFDRKIPVLLGFDIALSDFQQHSLGSTELMLGYESPTADLFSPKEDPNKPDGEL